MRVEGQRLREQLQGERADLFLGANGRLTLTDKSGRRVELTAKDGKKTLTVADADGKQVFSGPVDTADERKALPPMSPRTSAGWRACAASAWTQIPGFPPRRAHPHLRPRPRSDLLLLRTRF